MSRRERSRRRARRTQTATTTLGPERQPTASERETLRPRLGQRPSSIARATGQPSAPLLKAATVEYGYVTKDLRRIAVVAAGMLALLIAAAVAANTLLK